MADNNTAYFSELIHRFLGETVEAVQASYVQQLEATTRLNELVRMEVDDYARNYVTDEELAGEIRLRGLRPATLNANDLLELRIIVAIREREAIKNLLQRGIPKCVPSTGKLNLKFSYEIHPLPRRTAATPRENDTTDVRDSPEAPAATASVRRADLQERVIRDAMRHSSGRNIEHRGELESTVSAETLAERLRHSPIKSLSIDALRRTLAVDGAPSSSGPQSAPLDIKIKTFNATDVATGVPGQAACEIELEFQFLYD